MHRTPRARYNVPMPEVMQSLRWGDHAPPFSAAALDGSPTYRFDSAAGRHILMLFYGSGEFAASEKAFDMVRRARALFDDDLACFFGVTIDPKDAQQRKIAQQLPGIRYFLDYDRKVSTLYGACAGEAYRPCWLLLDPGLRILGIFPIADGEAAVTMLRSRLEAPFPDNAWAPVLMVPDVIEPEMCRHLISLYEKDGGKESGFMRDVNGKTVLMLDPSHKQRRDCVIDDEALRAALVARLKRRLNPALEKAFRFEATRIERYMVACYDAGAGHFRPHRDNTTKGTAHRQFAVTVNLNAGEYEGGDLRFPEYGRRTYCAPTGGAIVFSCSLLHEATPVTKGRRFAFLPFLYDEEAARIREANDVYLANRTEPYRANKGG